MLFYGDVRLPERLWKHVYPEPMSGCWLWGAGQSMGYAKLTSVTPMPLHRYFLILDTDHEPDSSIYACHHCDTRPCVNPSHLYWGDAKSNSGDHNGRHGHPNSHKTHCPAGHELVEGNLVPWKLARGVRECRKCSHAQKMAWKARNR
jgi:hypothetical protein